MVGYTGAQSRRKASRTKLERLEIVKLLIEQDADVNFESLQVKMTPLHWAAYNEDRAVVKYLVENGASIKFNKSGNTAVDIAGFCGIRPVTD